MKKIISIFLAIAMCFTMTTVAFAEDGADETAVSKDSIVSVLLEAAKIASELNDEAREKLGEELEKILVEQIAGDSVILQKAAQWIIDKALEISGSDNILTLDKAQAEKIAEILTKMYDGEIDEYIDNPIIKFIVKFIPEEFFKEAVVWILSDGLGDTLKDFINKYGDGETYPEEDDEPAEETPSNPLEGIDWAVAIQAAVQALKDVVAEVINQISALISGAQANPEPAPAA